MKRILLCLLIFAFARSSLHSQYADLGTGALKNQIWWMDWNGFVFSNGASRTFNTADGLTVTFTFSNFTNPPPIPSVMNTWSGAVLHLLYDFSNPNIQPAIYTNGSLTTNTQFVVAISATRSGVPTPFTLVAADAEASVVQEPIVLQTNGSAWQSIDFFRNSSQTTNPVAGCGTQTATISDTYAGAPQLGQNPVLATESTATGQLTINVGLNRTIQGLSAIAFGLFSPIDRGDLPGSYLYAQHALKFTYNNPCNYNVPFPSLTQSQSLKLGNIPGDADPAESNDDNANGADEDAISAFPIYGGSGSYSLTLPVTNTTGNTAYLTGWFDFNRNGVFDNNEYATTSIPNNTTSAVVTWNGLPASLPIGSVTAWAFRFRLSSNLNSTLNPSGFAPDGEVEDYLTTTLKASGADFSIPDTICVNSPITITNTSTNSSTYYWNFCSGSLNANPAGTNFPSPNFSMPVFSDMVQDGANYYVFVVNHTGSLARMSFGTSLLNTPTITDLGSFGGIIPFQAEGIAIQKDGNTWIGYIIGGQYANSRLLRLSFGTTVANIPTATNLGNIGGLDYPVDFTLQKDGNNWFGFTVSADNNTITRYNFGASLNNVPVATNLGNIGTLNYPVGIFLIKDAGNYYLFVTNRNSHTISRLDFGTSLSGTPAGTNLGNPGNIFNWPRDITVIRDCDRTFGFVVNEGTNNLTRLDFAGNNLTSAPISTDLGNVGNMNFPSSISEIFRTGDAINFIAANVNSNSITRMSFTNCTASTIPSYTGPNPPTFQFTQPGEYNISLFADEGLATKSVKCRKIVVVAPPVITLGNDTGFCANSTLLLGTALPQNASYLWSTAQTTQTISVQQAGAYSVTLTDRYSCVAKDTVNIVAFPSPVVSISTGRDTTICNNNSFTITASGGNSYTWSTGQTSASISVNTAGMYIVKGYNANGCFAADTLTVNFVPILVSAGNDTLICMGQPTQLHATGGTNFTWFPSTGLSDPLISNPIATTPGDITYYVTVTDAGGCSNVDSIKLSVRRLPQFQVNAPVAVCAGKATPLFASGGDVYLWSPASSLTNPSSANPFASPASTTTYSVNITDTVCHNVADLSTIVTVIQLPTVTASKSNDLDCSNDRSQLNAQGATTYQWSPSATLNNPGIANPVAMPTANTMYVVKGTDAAGCSNYDSVLVNFAFTNASGYFMPNAFTPNGDGLNDCFGIQYWGVIRELEFSVYNRWGQRLFFTKNPHDCWDGTFRGKKEDNGVYVYAIKAKTFCGDTFKKGTFVLAR